MGRKSSSLWLLPQVLGQLLLVVNQADSSPADKTIHIGYLLQFSDFGGAINVAIEQAQNDGLLRDYNFRYNCYSDLTIRLLSLLLHETNMLIVSKLRAAVRQAF